MGVEEELQEILNSPSVKELREKFGIDMWEQEENLRDILTASRIRRDDPRSPEQKKMDEAMQKDIESGILIRADEKTRQQAIKLAHKRKRIRAFVAKIGRRLGALRRLNGMTQAQVAEGMMTTPSAISRIESGKYGGLTFLKAARIDKWLIPSRQ